MHRDRRTAVVPDGTACTVVSPSGIATVAADGVIRITTVWSPGHLYRRDSTTLEWATLVEAHTPYVRPSEYNQLIETHWAAGVEIRLCRLPEWWCAVRVCCDGFTCISCGGFHTTFAKWAAHYDAPVTIPTGRNWYTLSCTMEPVARGTSKVCLSACPHYKDVMRGLKNFNPVVSGKKDPYWKRRSLDDVKYKRRQRVDLYNKLSKVHRDRANATKQLAVHTKRPK